MLHVKLSVCNCCIVYFWSHTTHMNSAGFWHICLRWRVNIWHTYTYMLHKVGQTESWHLLMVSCDSYFDIKQTFDFVNIRNIDPLPPAISPKIKGETWNPRLVNFINIRKWKIEIIEWKIEIHETGSARNFFAKSTQI